MYDRELTDILAIQDDIARSIVTELRSNVRRTGRGPSWVGDEVAEVALASKGRTANPEALQHFLQGRFFSARQTHANTAKALEFYDRAVVLDPNFASAWAAMASALASLGGYGGSVTVAETFRRARAAAQRALSLVPSCITNKSLI